jgi:L-lysine 2,3-aminomutase
VDVAEHSRVIFGVILSRNCSQMFRFCFRRRKKEEGRRKKEERIERNGLIN